MPQAPRSSRCRGFAGLAGATACCLATLAPPLSAEPASHTCRAIEIATFSNRIHVRCDTAASGGIVYFAVPTANNAHAARILSTLLAGHIAGKQMVMGYDATDTSGDAFDCRQADCRRLHYVVVR